MAQSGYTPRSGDLVEVHSDAGLAYIQCLCNVHGPPNYGSANRVLPGLWPSAIADLAQLVAEPHQFICLYPLQLAVRSKKVRHRLVGNFSLPSGTSIKPTFRASMPLAGGGYAEDRWHLWDTEREWFVGRLPPGGEQLPIRGVWNHTLLVERLARGFKD